MVQLCRQEKDPSALICDSCTGLGGLWGRAQLKEQYCLCPLAPKWQRPWHEVGRQEAAHCLTQNLLVTTSARSPVLTTFPRESACSNQLLTLQVQQYLCSSSHSASSGTLRMRAKPLAVAGTKTKQWVPSLHFFKQAALSFQVNHLLFFYKNLIALILIQSDFLLCNSAHNGYYVLYFKMLSSAFF